MKEKKAQKAQKEVRLDFDRLERKGVGEIVYCSGKSDDQLRQIASEVREQRENMLFSRLSSAQAELLREYLPQLKYDERTATGKFVVKPVPARGRVAVLSAGSSDVPIAAAAAEVAAFLGCSVECYYDVGVAGLHRLLDLLPRLREVDVAIVAAGMDGALPSVVAGLIPALVVALPTSVGYGVADGGKAALNAMLCSCSPGVVVVNIDNAVGAGVAAAIASSPRGRKKGKKV